MKRKAIIISISGYTLTKNEATILSKENPWGLILFKRNIKSIFQLKKLIKKIRKITKDKYFPIMIDEEGGTVTRISRIIKHDLYQKLFGDIYKVNTHQYENIVLKLQNIIQLAKEQFSNVSSFSRDYIIKSFSKSQMVKNYFNLYEQESI